MRQVFIPESYARIRQLRDYIDRNGFDVKIEVDGGIGKKNVIEVIKAGADICVAGSAVFKKRSIRENVSVFMEKFEEQGKEDKK